VDCRQSEWSEWGDCDRTCIDVRREYYRLGNPGAVDCATSADAETRDDFSNDFSRDGKWNPSKGIYQTYTQQECGAAAELVASNPFYQFFDR
ncbi:unnamed protein product, partial [Amoebophrya sp. A120]